MSAYTTEHGRVILTRTFGPERARVNYRVYAHPSGKALGTVSRLPHNGLKWEIINDPVRMGRSFSTRRAAIETLQKAAA